MLLIGLRTNVASAHFMANVHFFNRNNFHFEKIR